MPYRIYVGSYTNDIYTLAFDPDAPSLTLTSTVTVGFHPSWITPHPSDPNIVFAGLEQQQGEVVTVLYDDAGQGTVLGSAPTHAADPCCLLAHDNELLIANYSGGIVTVIPLSDSRSRLDSSARTNIVFEGTGPNRDRQEKSHPHQVILHPDRQELLVPDLGADKTWRLTKRDTGHWTTVGYLEYTPGSGPRHVAFYDGVLYTVCELTSQVSAHRFPPLPAAPTPLATAPLMSNFPGPPSEIGMLGAEILLPPPNASFPAPYIYASNRNDPSPDGDVIAIFAAENLELVREVRSGLNHLRGMLLGGPDLKYLIAGGAQGGGVKVFERIDGGKGLREVAALPLDAPTAFLWN